MSSALKIKSVVSVSVTGNRPLQEDCMLSNKERGVFVVADGFGGMKSGDQASNSACRNTLDFLEREAGDDEATFPFIRKTFLTLAGNVLFNAVVHANRKMFASNKARPFQGRGGSSLVAAYVDGVTLALANVGSCSAWLWRQGRWKELLAPKSYLRQCDPFADEFSDTLDFPLMALGVNEDVEPAIAEVRLQPGDRILLQSDGVDRSLRERLEAGDEKVLQAQLEAALGQESRKDNTTILMINL
jgi:serine/threonine protein phosphatase PrpC